MVVVGGVTRLTDSGLSIVEWQPSLAPFLRLARSDWEELFEKYHQTPQYKKVNLGMSLDEFKGIFWWEYFHRLLGRVIGLAFFVPFLYFIVRKAIDGPLGLKLAGIFLLGGLQGAMGWYMVKSGLVDNPHVSQYRLTAHLGLAFVIYAAMFWVALGLLAARRCNRRGAFKQQVEKFAPVFHRADRAHIRHGLIRRIRCRYSGRAGLQYFSFDEWSFYSAGNIHAGAMVSEFLR